MNVECRQSELYLLLSNSTHGPFIQQPAAEGVHQHHGVQQGQAGQHP
jgi:hypothetical protein